MDADFDWGGVQASTPVFKKGDYELEIKKVRGSAWPKKDKQGNPTGDITQVIRLRCEMQGVLDSKGKLQGKQDGKEIRGVTTEEANLWVHTDGGRKQAKKVMMAICGYNPEEQSDEDKFNAFLKKSGLDLSFKAIPKDDDSGYTLEIGEGWAALLEGKQVRCTMDEEIRKQEGREDSLQQNFVRFSPING